MKVKFCGITNIKDARKAIELGVDYIGFIVDFPKSPRSISVDDFIKLASEIKRDSDVKIVAVTVDMGEEKLSKLVDSGLVDVIQFHGDEEVEICKKFKNKVEIWKNVNNGAWEHGSMGAYLDYVDKFLIDATTIEEKLKGKNNKFDSFDEFKQLKDEGYRLILAGGLNPENIESYIEKLNPEIIDVASGIESEPGKKDYEKMIRFMQVVKKF